MRAKIIWLFDRNTQVESLDVFQEAGVHSLKKLICESGWLANGSHTVEMNVDDGHSGCVETEVPRGVGGTDEFQPAWEARNTLLVKNALRGKA